MGYQRQSNKPRSFVRKAKAPKRGKERKRGTSKKRRVFHPDKWEETSDLNSEEVRDITLKKLDILGNQTFVLPPFHVHFDRWISNLVDIITVDSCLRDFPYLRTNGRSILCCDLNEISHGFQHYDMSGIIADTFN